MDNNGKPTMNNTGADEDEPKTTPSDHVHSDLTLAMDVVIDHHHHQQNAAVRENSIQEEEEEEEEGDWSSSDEDEDEDEDENEYEFFDSQGIEEVDFEGFLEEGQGSNYSDDEMEEDDIDPDEMTYEELMALGEFIGPAEKRGLSMEEILGAGCLRRGRKVAELLADVDRCVICQAEYEEGGGGGGVGGDVEEELAEIVGCGHPYHAGCITNWLLVKKNCPICGYEVSPSSCPPSNVKEPCR